MGTKLLAGNRRGLLGLVLAAALLPIATEAEARGGGGRKSGSRDGRSGSSGGGGNSGGCGSRGGAGYRKANGKCAGRNE